METIPHIRELPELTTDTIHIWGVHVPDVLDQLDRLHSLLSTPEQEKAGRFHRDSDRQSSIAARGSLRILLSGYTGIPAAEIKFGYSKNGKPYLLDSAVNFNVSHSGDWVLLAFGWDRQIGVDIEKIKRSMDVSAIALRYFSPEEIETVKTAADSHTAFFQLWAHKEAYVKACGSTLFQELSRDVTNGVGWILRPLEVDPKYAAAVVTDQELSSVWCYDFGGLKWAS